MRPGGAMSRHHAERGQILVLTALAALTLLAVVALVIDGGLAWAKRREAQNAADLAALAGARLVGVAAAGTTVHESDVTAELVAIADANGHVTLPGLGTAAGPVYLDASYNVLGPVGNGAAAPPANARGIRIQTATTSWHPFLASLVGFSQMDASATATAVSMPNTSVPCAFCVIGTNPPPLSLQSGKTMLRVTNGAIASDGGLTMSANPSVISTGTGAAVEVYGAVNLCKGCIPDPPVTVLSAPIPDPLAFLPDPVATGTNYGSVQAKGPGTKVTLSPGVYAGWTIEANATIQLQPGTYYLTGDVSVQSNGSLIGAGGVTLVFMGPSSSFLPQSNSTINIVAPPSTSTTATFPGMAFYFARDNKGTLQMQSSSTTSVSGTIYAVNAASLLDMQSGTTAATINSMVVVGSANFQSGSQLNVNYDSSMNVRLPAGPTRLVE